MATDAKLTIDATSEWGTDGTAYNAIPEATQIAIPTVETDYVEVTSLSSPNRFREYIPGLKDAGTLEIPCNFTADLYAAAKGYQDNQTLLYFRTTLPPFEGQTSGDVFEFRAYVTPAVQSTEAGAALAMSLNLRVSGDLTHTPGSTS